MTVGNVAGLIAAVAFAVMAGFTAWVLYKVVVMLSVTNLFLDEIREETIPMMTRLQVTMDHVNTELTRVDGILTAVEGMSQKTNEATKVVQEVVTSPVVKLIGVGAGAGKAYSKKKKK
jgi:uncharacterized protein YoxC